MKRLVLSFDGTWNTPDGNGDEDGNTNTNVRRLHEAVLPRDGGGTVQEAWYDRGVGTEWYNRLAGGVAGVGLSRNIRQGYRHLAEHYEDGDEIYVFGFSRGAYTARSLVGLIRNCGILKEPDDMLVHEAYLIYRTRDDGADSEQAKAFRREFARPGNVEIKCLGVWDTVGALGIPVQSFGFFNRHFYEFHDTKLSSTVKNAFQALAIDEHRQEYEATLWSPSERPDQRIEQAWFPGAHSNIGGGYPDDVLADVTLAWMFERARSCGLALDPQAKPVLGEQHWTQESETPLASSCEASIGSCEAAITGRSVPRSTAANGSTRPPSNAFAGWSTARATSSGAISAVRLRRQRRCRRWSVAWRGTCYRSSACPRLGTRSRSNGRYLARTLRCRTSDRPVLTRFGQKRSVRAKHLFAQSGWSVGAQAGSDLVLTSGSATQAAGSSRFTRGRKTV